MSALALSDADLIARAQQYDRIASSRPALYRWIRASGESVFA